MSPHPKRKKTIAHLVVNWALTHRVTVFMSFLALVILGLVSYTRIPLQFMPTGFNPPFMGVYVSYPNANAIEIDEKIADPLVAQLRTVRGLKNASARSTSNGCFIFLEFRPTTDMDAAYMEVRNRMERIRPDLPEGVERYRIWKFNPDDEPVFWISSSIPENVKNPYHFIETKLMNPILRIEGVGRVEINGLQEPEVIIELHQDAIERHRINLLNLIQKLRSENLSIVSGHIDEGSRRYYIRSDARWRDINEIASIQITRSGLRLKDIANVRIGTPDPDAYLLINGKPGVTVEIYKEASASSVMVSRRIREWLKTLQNNPENHRDWHFEILFDEGSLIEQSIRDLQEAGVYGAILATIILYFFLRNLRMTLTIALAMPLSLTMTLIVMYFAGETLNLVSMMGLMLAIGMVVDNAVVVVESIDRYRQQGLSAFRAAYEGASEVGLAVLTATGTTLVVFLPLILINDDIGFAFYMARLGFPVCVALVASLVVALIFIPVGNMLFAGGKQKVSRVVEKSRKLYEKMISWVLSTRLHRSLTMLFIVILFFSMFYAKSKVPVSDSAQGHVGDYRVIIELPPNYTLEKARKLLENLSAILLEHKEELSIRTVYARVRSGWSQLRIFMKPKEERTLDREEAIEKTRKLLPNIPGVNYRFGWSDMGRGSARIYIFGTDMRRLQSIMEDIAPRIRRLPEVVDVEIPTDLRTNELHIGVQDWIGQRLSVNPFMLAQSLAFAVRGLTFWSAFPYGDDYINMKIIYRKSDREDLSRIMDFKVPTNTGQPLPVRSVARWQFASGIGQIERRNNKVQLPLTINLKSDADMMRFMGTLRGLLDRYPWPKEYGWDMGSRFRDFQQSQQSQQFALLVAIVLVFLLMGTLFESVVLPFCILFSIPFAFVGVYWLLFITGTQFDIMAAIGLVILIGIVVNNAIVLIDRVNQLRHEGHDLISSLVNGGTQRFRPIWMTALTTIMGMIPMALGKGELVGISYAPLARAVIGGLLTSTFVTLFIVPLMYYFAVNWQNRVVILFNAVFQRVRHKKAAPPVTPAVDG